MDDGKFTFRLLYPMESALRSLCNCMYVGPRVLFENDGRNASFFCSVSVTACVTSKVFTVLSVGYCVRHKNQYSTYCAVLSQVLAAEVQYLPNVIN